LPRCHQKKRRRDRAHQLGKYDKKGLTQKFETPNRKTKKRDCYATLDASDEAPKMPVKNTVVGVWGAGGKEAPEDRKKKPRGRQTLWR